MEPLKDLKHCTQIMKTPRIREPTARLAEQARSDGWSQEDYLAAALPREVTARESSATQNRIASRILTLTANVKPAAHHRHRENNIRTSYT